MGSAKKIKLNDNRQIDVASGKPVTDATRMGHEIDPAIAEDIIAEAQKQGVDPHTALAVAMQETGVDWDENNPFHLDVPNMNDEEKKKLNANPVAYSIGFLKDKMDYGRKLGKTDEASILQAYNGYGKVGSRTESDYYKGKPNQSFYGIDVSKEPIDMNKNPVYGKRVIDLRDNVLKQNPQINHIVQQYPLPVSEIPKTHDVPTNDFHKGGIVKGGKGKDDIALVDTNTGQDTGVRVEKGEMLVVSKNNVDKARKAVDKGDGKTALNLLKSELNKHGNHSHFSEGGTVDTDELLPPPPKKVQSVAVPSSDVDLLPPPPKKKSPADSSTPVEQPTQPSSPSLLNARSITDAVDAHKDDKPLTVADIKSNIDPNADDPRTQEDEERVRIKHLQDAEQAALVEKQKAEAHPQYKELTKTLQQTGKNLATIDQDPNVKAISDLYQKMNDEVKKGDINAATGIKSTIEQLESKHTPYDFSEEINEPKATDGNGNVIPEPLSTQTYGDVMKRYHAESVNYNSAYDQLKNITKDADSAKATAQKLKGFTPDEDGVKTENGLLTGIASGVGSTMSNIGLGLLHLTGNEDKAAELSDKKALNDYLYPTQIKRGTSGSIGQMLGSVAPYVIPSILAPEATPEMMAAEEGGMFADAYASLPSMAKLAQAGMGASMMALSAKGEMYHETYQQAKADGLDEQQARLKAEHDSNVSAAAQGAVGAVLPYNDNLIAPILKAGEMTVVQHALAHAGLGLGEFGLSGAIEDAANGKDVLKGLADRTEQGAALMAVMHVISAAPKALGGSLGIVKNIVETSMARRLPDVEMQINNMVQTGQMTQEQADKFLIPLTQKSEVLAKIPPDLPTMKEQAILPLMQEKQGLLEKKKALDKVFHPKIDAKIEGIDKEISDILAGRGNDETIADRNARIAEDMKAFKNAYPDLPMSGVGGIKDEDMLHYGDHKDAIHEIADNPVSEPTETPTEDGIEPIHKKSGTNEIQQSGNVEDNSSIQKNANSESTTSAEGDYDRTEPTASIAASHITENTEPPVSDTPKVEAPQVETPVVEPTEPIKEETKEPQSYTSLKNERVDSEREKRGLSPAIQEARKAFGKSWDDAMKILDDNPNATDELINGFGDVKGLKEKPRPLSDVENALLLHKQIELQNDYAKQAEAVNEAQEKGDEGALLEARTRLAGTSGALQDVYDIGKKVGTENARGLAIRRALAKEDYSLASMETQKRAANNGKPLSPEVQKEIADLHQRITDTQKAFEDYVSNAEKKRAEDTAKETFKSQRRARNKVGKDKIDASITQRVSNIKDKGAAILAKIAEKSGGKMNLLADDEESLTKLLKEIAPDIADLAKDYARKGIINLEDIVDHIHEQIGDALGLSKRNVRDAISGYGIEKEKSTRSELQKELDRLKAEARKLSKSEDIQSGAKEDPRLKAYKTRTANRIKEVEGKLKSGDFAKTERRPIGLDKEGLALKAEYERAKQEFDLGLEKDRLKNRNGYQKTLDAIVKWGRAAKLSSPVTLAKLTAAAAIRMTVTPVEELIGGGISKIIPNIANKALREGGFNSKAEARAIKDGIMKGIADSYKNLTIKKGGKSDIDVLLGEKRLPPEAIDFFGHIHSALKAPAKRAEFERSLQKRLDANIRNGVDVSDPMVQTSILVDAYKDANRAIFMQDNLVSDAYKNLTGYLENSKKHPLAGKLSASVLNELLPFVKVPTNVIGETFQYAGGVPREVVRGIYRGGRLISAEAAKKLGAEKVATVLKNGVKELSPDDADMVLRNLKKGSIGAAFMVLGYLSPNSVGGYNRKDKDGAEGLEEGELKIGDVTIPKFLLHNPLMETLQIGATIRQVQEHYINKEDEYPLAKGAWAALMGLTSQTPFIDQASRMDKLAKHPTDYAGEFVKGATVPALLDWIARQTDRDSEGNKIKRKPDSFIEHIESGIPWLRERIGNDEPTEHTRPMRTQKLK